ncbi:MAG: DUF2252 family protein [Actinomycetes bacterium]
MADEQDTRSVPAQGGSTASAKRAPAKKAVVKKAPAKKTVARKTVAKKAGVKKAPAKKAPTRKVPAKQVAATQGRHHPYRTLDDRVNRGLSWRDVAPIEGMGEFDPSPSRPSALALLSAQDDARVSDLLPIRYGRMSASAFAYYRGAAAVMAYDLAQQPRTPGGTQICGDAHLSNFGFFGSPERDLLFDVNDFDETLPGPFEWDVKRLTASFILAARDRGFKRKVGRAAAVAAAEAYRTSILTLASAGNLQVWYTKVDSSLIEQSMREIVSQSLNKKETKLAETRLSAVFEKARSKTSLRAAEKLTEVVDGRRRFLNAPPLLSTQDIPTTIRSEIERLFGEYKDTLQNDRRRLLERYEYLDIALKVVGVGSVGTRAAVLLLQGRDLGDPLVLQVKQAQASVLEAYLRPSEYDNHGQRVVEGQRYMQSASDIFLGWVRNAEVGRDFYIRQLHDMKGSLDIAKVLPVGLEAYGRLCGGTLARAHARGGDVVAIASYLGDDDRFAQAVTRFAEAYADQSERDYAELKQAIADGRVAATSGI